MTSERQAYVYAQLPGTLETVPTALLKVQTLPNGTQIGRFRYGDRYPVDRFNQFTPNRLDSQLVRHGGAK